MGFRSCFHKRVGVFEPAFESKARLLTLFAPNCTLQPTAAIRADHVITEIEIAASHTHHIYSSTVYQAQYGCVDTVMYQISPPHAIASLLLLIFVMYSCVRSFDYRRIRLVKVQTCLP